MSFMKCRHVLDFLPQRKRIMNLTLTQTHMKENSSKRHVFPKSVSRTAILSPHNIEVDSDSESDITPEEEQEEPEQEEVTAADDLSLLDRLRQGGLAHVDATEPYEPVIDYSDDDDYAFIDDTDRDY